MTANERALYDLAAEKDSNQVPKIEREGAKDFFLEMALRCRRQACSNIYKFSGQERAFTESQALLMYHKTKKAGTEYTFEYAPKLSEPRCRRPAASTASARPRTCSSRASSTATRSRRTLSGCTRPSQRGHRTGRAMSFTIKEGLIVKSS